MRNIFLFSLLAMTMLAGMASAIDITPITAVSSLDEYNDYAAAPTTWTALMGNGSYNNYAWPAGYDLIIMVNVTGVLDTNYLNIMAGDNPPAFRSGMGNLTISNWTDGIEEVKYIGPLESARFMNNTGYLEISSLNLTGKLAVLKVRE